MTPRIINFNNNGRVFQYIFNNLIHFDQNINMYAELRIIYETIHILLNFLRGIPFVWNGLPVSYTLKNQP